ncbi:MAG: gliding motility-associated C-terminal domain-containing protein [Saprospiraceae bacterium]|nr:gliding motility-associated C-terminal domain-containing protein [Saprospiraceae bacterium]
MTRLLHVSLFFLFFFAAVKAGMAQCTNPTIQLPDASTPVNGNPATAYCTTFTFDPSLTGMPTGLSMQLQHTWQGDLSIFIAACGNTLMVMNRPGVIASCTGGCPCGNSNDIGSPGAPVLVTFSDGGGPDPENGVAQGGGAYGVTSDNSCNVSTVSSFAQLWAGCPPGPISAQVCIADHAGADTGVAADVTLIYPNPVICGCTNPSSPNYNPAANVDDGSCLPNCAALSVSAIANGLVCAGGSISITTTVSGASVGATYNWTGANIGFLSPTNSPNPTVTVPPTFTGGSLSFNLTVTDGPCSQSTVVVIPITPPTPPQITGTPTLCPGQTTASLSVSGFYTSYNWSNGSTTASTQVASPGIYTVTVTEPGGCVTTASVTVTALPTPEPQITGPASICQGGSATLSAGPGFSTYAWSNGNFGSSITINQAGLYIVTVTNAAGCAGTAQIIVLNEPPPVPGIFGNNQICPNGGSTVLSGELGYSSYQWSTGAFTPDVLITSPGTYTLTATHPNGCVGTNTFTVTLIPVTPATIQGPATLCAGDFANLTVQPFSYVSYLWSDGQTGQSITATQAGTYSVTATTAQGCDVTASITIASAPSPNPVISGNLAICPGASTTLNAGPGFTSYQWSDGGSTASLVTSQPGTYSVTVTNTQGCEGTASVTVTPSPVPSPVISGPSEICPGGLANLDAGAGYVSYQWSSGTSGQQLSVNAPGTYAVTVTNAAGCSDSTSFTIAPAPVPNPAISGALSFCQGTNTTLNAGPGFSTYAWSNGGNSATNTVSAPGAYTVTVTNASGCSNTATVNVTATPNPVPAISGNLEICPGASTTLNVTGSFSSYAWSTGGSGASITANAAGSYMVTVTDAQGCTGTTSATVSVLNAPTPQITGANTFCFDSQTTLDAGPGYASYQWTPSGNTQEITASNSGTYSVIVTDQNGCTGTTSIQVTELPQVVPSISGNAGLCLGQTSANLTASAGYTSYAWSTGGSGAQISVQTGGVYTVTVVDVEGCSGTASFTVTGNTPPAPAISGATAYCQGASTTLSAPAGFSQYLWSNGSNSASLTASAPGNYSVTVTDNNGCTGQASVQVTENPNPVPDISGVLQICPGGSTTLNAGITATGYQWSTGATTQTISVSTAGTYGVTVTDANGCVGADNATVVQVPQLQPTISGVLFYCAGSSTQLSANSGYATYSWSNAGNQAAITVSAPGTYSVTVTDLNGCSGETSVSVTERALPTPQILGNLSYCEGNSTTLNSSGNFPTYNWSNGASTAGITLSTPGNYGLTVTDSFGCQGSTSVQVVEHPLVFPNITGTLSFCEGLQTVLNAGAGFATYQWSNNTSNPTLTVTSGGAYSVTVTDANGCVTNAGVTVTEFPVTAPQVTGNTAFCTGDNVVLDAGAGYAAYQWSNSMSGQTVTITQGGFYSVTATDVNGCVSDGGIQVTQNPLPNIVIGGSSSFCIGGYTTLNAGTGFAQYQWSDGSTTPTIQVSQPGLIAVTVTDSNGCSASDDLTVTQDTELSPVINGNLTFCPGTQTVLDAGPGYATYIWSNNAGSQTITVTQPGTYTVTVTDDFGCFGSGDVAVGLFPQPQPVIAGTPSFCAGSNTVLSSGTPFTVYQWSTGAAQPQITVATPGTYGLTVTDSNGCVASTSQMVEEFPLPVFGISGLNYFCAGASTAISVPNTFAGYQWSGGQQTPDISVGTAGNYSITVTNSFGCVSSQSIQIAQIPLPLSDAGPARELTCNFPSVTLGGPGSSQGSAYVYQWSGPGITAANGSQAQPVVTAPGSYTLMVTDTVHNCVSTVNATQVADLTAPPMVMTNALDTLDCVTPSVVVSGNGSATGADIAYQWIGPGGTPIPGATALTYTASVPGVYTLRVINNYTGCTAQSVSTVAQDVALPAADAGPGRHLNCITTADALDGGSSSTGNNFAYLWSTVGGNIVSGATGLAPVVNRPGLYILRVTNQQNGCVTTDSVQVTQDIVAPTAFAGQTQEIDCLHPSVGIDGTGSSTGGNMRYEWTLNGSPAVLSTALAWSVTVPGLYTLRVINTVNGCSAASNVVVTENPARPRDVAVLSNDPICFGDTNGRILLGAVTGGTAPFLFSINGEPFRAQTLYPNLGAGDYNIIVQDATGCEYALTVNLREGNDLALDLGPDQYIRIGERAIIEAQYNIPDAEVSSFGWTTVDSLECLTCLTLNLRPFITTTYSATLVDDRGCRITEQVTIYVANPREVFIPNAFSPNNDGTNDRLMVFAGEDVDFVRSFMVFNRWGEAVFEVYNFPPNDPAYGWDGNHRARLYNSAVFVYFAEVQFIDGSVKLFKGDATLMK